MNEETVALQDIEIPNGCQRIRGLLWCSATVRCRRLSNVPLAPREPWQTDWKWCVGVWWPHDGKPVSDPESWYVPGISDCTGVEVLKMEATHFSPLPTPPEPTT